MTLSTTMSKSETVKPCSYCAYFQDMHLIHRNLGTDWVYAWKAALGQGTCSACTSTGAKPVISRSSSTAGMALKVQAPLRSRALHVP